MRSIRSYSLTAVINLLYPRLLAIHDLAEEVGFPGPNGRLKLPSFMRASYAYMVAEGAYLLSTSCLNRVELSLIGSANGEIAIIWFGGGVSPQIVDDLYGTDNVQELDVRMVCSA